MSNAELKTVFTLLNYALGLIITIISIKLFTRRGLTVPLYITAAILVAGPIENLLMRLVKPEERWIVDQITSILFLIFLLLAILDSSKLT